ncbi:PepSY-associated TM helix domain-containing protein [Undibacterium flavidum]|uniref:PepSY domain-containing protein n=1 Tax=Undibacterium flavidum TaxID=2762297 RepID=A0ABR6Y663_9BURK|nr:PepSY domain-containing protein [Undibacterium flavidum]MBC3872113.1 PepSY domain-containing protein [Undibacterium flavidum]
MRNQLNRSALLQRVFWRLHFWAGLITAPILLFAAISGLLYVFTPQIEGWCHAQLDTVDAIAPAQNLDAQIAAGQAQFPGESVRTIIPAYTNTQTTQIIFGEKKKRNTQISQTAKNSEHQHHAETTAQASPFIAYINPGTLKIQASIAEDGRFREWARKLHSTMLQDDSWRWIIELGASWMIMMLITGIYLWWPRGKASWASVLRWNSSQNRRANWRYLHSIISVILSIVTLVIMLTGITWSKYAGENFRSMQTALGQSSPKPPKDLHSTFVDGMPALSAQAIYLKARQLAPAVQIQITPPKSAQGIWRIENYDRSQPEKRFQLLLDAYTGAVLYQSGWGNLPLLAQATAVGIPFHRGEFGWWNQVLLILVGFSVIFSVISGYVMWLQRRKARSVSAPAINTTHAIAIPWWIWLLLLALGFALPVFGVSLFILMCVEAALMFKQIKSTTQSK